MAITSVVSHTFMQSLVMRLGLCHRGIHLWFVAAISEFICDTVVHKGQRDCNCYKCISTRDNGNVITYNRESSWSASVKKTFLIANL